MNDTVRPGATKARAKPEGSGGSRKGIPNKVNSDVKAMILAALDKAGGADYLLSQSESNPTAFMTLVGKVLPLNVAGTLKAEINWPLVKPPLES